MYIRFSFSRSISLSWP